MFRFFKSKKFGSLQTEIELNPKILFERRIESEKLSLFGIRLRDSVDNIKIDSIFTTSMEKPPPGTTKSRWYDGKTYYYIGDQEYEFLLSDRIESVFATEGWLHMDNGAKYRIRNKVVVEFALHDRLVEAYKNIKKWDIEKKFGKANRIKKNYEQVDGTLFSTVYIYEYRQIRVHFQDWDNVVDGINIGESHNDYS